MRPEPVPRPPLARMPAAWLLAGLLGLLALACSAPAEPLPTRPATDTPRYTARPSRTGPPLDAATPTPSPTTVPPEDTHTPTPTDSPTRPPATSTRGSTPTTVFADPRYGVDGSWGCAVPGRQPFYKMGLSWVFWWGYAGTGADAGQPGWMQIVRSVPDVMCAEGSARNERGWCINQRISTPSDLAGTPSLTDTLHLYPGGYWSMGNEPNGRPNLAVQIQPEDYADWYHAMAAIVLRNDPQAKLILGGLASVENAAADIPQDEYADRFYRTYIDRYGERPPVDIWAIHVYPDWDRSPQLMLDEFNAWRRSVGEEGRPLWVTEFSYGRKDISHATVINWMHETIRAFEASGVERWFWYTGHASDGNPTRYLWYCNGTLTPAGEEYYKLAHGLISP